MRLEMYEYSGRVVYITVYILGFRTSTERRVEGYVPRAYTRGDRGCTNRAGVKTKIAQRGAAVVCAS